MKILVVIFVVSVSLQSCSNSAFFYPSRPSYLNPQIQRLDSKSGNKLAYLWIEAENGLTQGLVVHFHGNSGHMEKTQEKVDWLSEHGYSVLVFDYSGFGHSTGRVSDKSAYQDAISIIDFISTIRAKLKLPTFVIATSTGGNIFIRAWVDNPSQFDGIILDSTFSSYVDLVEYTLQRDPIGKLYSWIASIIMRDDYSAKKVIANIPQSNLLVIHCTKDIVVPIGFSEQIYAQLIGNKTFIRFDNCKHARAITREFPQNQKIIVNWLRHCVLNIANNNAK